jgi:hypothetical protein
MRTQVNTTQRKNKKRTTNKKKSGKDHMQRGLMVEKSWRALLCTYYTHARLTNFIHILYFSPLFLLVLGSFLDSFWVSWRKHVMVAICDLKPIFLMSSIFCWVCTGSLSELAVHWLHDQNPKLVWVSYKHYEYTLLRLKQCL